MSRRPGLWRRSEQNLCDRVRFPAALARVSHGETRRERWSLRRTCSDTRGIDPCEERGCCTNARRRLVSVESVSLGGALAYRHHESASGPGSRGEHQAPLLRIAWAPAFDAGGSRQDPAPCREPGEQARRVRARREGARRIRPLRTRAPPRMTMGIALRIDIDSATAPAKSRNGRWLRRGPCNDRPERPALDERAAHRGGPDAPKRRMHLEPRIELAVDREEKQHPPAQQPRRAQETRVESGDVDQIGQQVRVAERQQRKPVRQPGTPIRTAAANRANAAPCESARSRNAATAASER